MGRTKTKSSELGGKTVTYDELKPLIKQTTVCPLCGETFIKITAENRRYYWSLDHIIPKAVFKWSLNKFPNDKDAMAQLLDTMDNYAIVHTRCNVSKGNTLHVLNHLEDLHCSESTLDTYRANIEKASKYISYYRHLFTRVLNRQRSKCYLCGNPIQGMAPVMRRIDSNKKRTMKNAMLVCSSCNCRLH